MKNTGMTPTITMITPVLNGEASIQTTFDSVRAQGPWCTEYIVIDAMSTDGTAAIVEKNSDLVGVYIREPDRGLYDAMNKGIGRASGEVIGIINADDRLCAGALEQVAKAFSDPAVGFVYSDVLTLDEKGDHYDVARAKDLHELQRVSAFGLDWRTLIPFCHASLFVRKRVYDALGAFDLSYRLAADHDFIARMLHAKVKGVKVAQPLAYYRYGGLSTNGMAIFREKRRISVRYGVHPVMAGINQMRCSLGRVKARLLGRY
jgi:glycosyltransferase